MGDRLRVRTAADYLGLSWRSLSDRVWRLKHGIPAMKVGRALLFDRAQLDAWLLRHQERPIRAMSTPEDPDQGRNGGD